MAPGAPPQEGHGTSKHRWALGGRYLEQVYRGKSMGMPMQGLGYTGYDNSAKQYVNPAALNNELRNSWSANPCRKRLMIES